MNLHYIDKNLEWSDYHISKMSVKQMSFQPIEHSYTTANFFREFLIDEIKTVITDKDELAYQDKSVLIALGSFLQWDHEEKIRICGYGQKFQKRDVSFWKEPNFGLYGSSIFLTMYQERYFFILLLI